MAASTAADALYRALRSANADPDPAHDASEEVRELAGQKVIDAIAAQITELRAELGTQIAELNASMDTRFAELQSETAEIRAEIKAQGARIEDLRLVVWRVIWPLIALLATTVFGLLYQVVVRE